MDKEINIKTPGQILDYVDTKEHLLDLFNYITNLQQAIKDTKDTADDMLYELKQENERLKMRNDMLRKDIDSFIVDNKIDYKSRCEKAIEYIKSGKTFDNEDTRKAVDKIQNDLLNILQNGGEKQ